MPRPKASGPIRTIWVVPISHLDIGFTAAQDEVFRQYKEYIDQVLAYLDEDPDFAYTVETVWQYLAWERQTSDPTAVARLGAYAGQGRIAVGAAFASMHTGMLGMEEIHRVFYPSVAVAEKLGVEVATAWMNDIPGYNWALPRTLARAGIRYFVTGLNLSLGGGADIPPASIPFYWEGPDHSRVLTWASTRNYLEAWEKYRLHEDDVEAMEAGIRKVLGEWTEAGYPYDAVLAIASAGDNLGPQTARKIVRGAREWNARHDDVRIVIGTAEQFFWHMERKYAGSFPVLTGDWNGLWEFARAANAHGTAVSRRVRFLLPGVEAHGAIKAVTTGDPYPKEALGRACESLLTYDEHSAGNGTGWPKLLTRAQVVRHNRIAYGYALDCADAFETVKRIVFEPRPTDLRATPGSEEEIAVANGLSWTRDGPVDIALSEADKVTALVDIETGERLPVEHSGGSLRFWARGVPSFGWRTYRILTGGKAYHGGEPAADVAVESDRDVAIENRWYRVAVSAEGIVQSIYDKVAGRECFNRDSGWAWNALVRSAHLDGRGPDPVEPHLRGIAKRIRRLGMSGIRIDRPGAHRSTEIALPDGSPRVEFHHTVDLEALERDKAHRARAWYYFLFPFAVDRREFDFQYDTAAGMISPMRHTMKGAPRGAWPVQSVVALQESKGFGVAVSNRESFLWCKVPFGRLSPDPAPTEPTLASVLFGLNDKGESKDQGVVRYSLEEREPAGTSVRTFSYALTTWADGFDPVRAMRFGYEWNAPLFGTTIAPREPQGADSGSSSGLPAGALVGTDADNVFVTAVKLPEDAPEGRINELVVRLQEVAGRDDTVVTLDVGGRPVANAVLCDVLERPYKHGSGFLPTEPIRLTIGSREVLTLRVRLAPGGEPARARWWRPRSRLQPH